MYIEEQLKILNEQLDNTNKILSTLLKSTNDSIKEKAEVIQLVANKDSVTTESLKKLSREKIDSGVLREDVKKVITEVGGEEASILTLTDEQLKQAYKIIKEL